MIRLGAMGSTAPVGSGWLVRHPRSAKPEHRLFCFPYAGGSAQVFHGWAELFPPTIEIVAIQAPGKGSRLLEEPCASLHEICNGLIPEMMPLLRQQPFSFFGHSNGAMVAFELSCRLQHEGLPLPRQLLLSASPAPWTRFIEKPFSAMTDPEFKAALKELGGTPAEILENDALFDLVLPGLRADFSLAENYRYKWMRKLSTQTHVFFGETDAIEERQIFAWQDHIGPVVSFDRIAGGHFFIHSHAKQLAGLIQDRLRLSMPPDQVPHRASVHSRVI